MTVRMPWAGQAKGILEGCGGLCLLIFLLLQYPGVHSKCYFQAQGKAGPNPKKEQGQIKGLGIDRWLRDVPVSESHNFYTHKKKRVLSFLLTFQALRS